MPYSILLHEPGAHELPGHLDCVVQGCYGIEGVAEEEDGEGGVDGCCGLALVVVSGIPLRRWVGAWD